jgi:hypothetical protein
MVFAQQFRYNGSVGQLPVLRTKNDIDGLVFAIASEGPVWVAASRSPALPNATEIYWTSAPFFKTMAFDPSGQSAIDAQIGVLSNFTLQNYNNMALDVAVLNRDRKLDLAARSNEYSVRVTFGETFLPYDYVACDGYMSMCYCNSSAATVICPFQLYESPRIPITATSLDMSSAQLTSVHNHSLQPLLTVLSLNNNSLTILPVPSAPLTLLFMLTVQFNKLVSLGSGELARLAPAVNSVGLGGNPLLYVSEDALAGLSSIKNLLLFGFPSSAFARCGIHRSGPLAGYPNCVCDGYYALNDRLRPTYCGS